MTTKSSLINLTLFCSRKGHSIGFKLENSLWCLFAHIMDCVLITKPIATFNSIISMPSPIIIVHVSKSCIDAALSCNCMRTSREEFRNTGSLESLLNKTKSSSQSSSSGTNYNGVKGMIDYCIFFKQLILNDHE